MFWVISVYFNIRNTLPKSGTFLLGHPVYMYNKTLSGYIACFDNLNTAVFYGIPYDVEFNVHHMYPVLNFMYKCPGDGLMTETCRQEVK